MSVKYTMLGTLGTTLMIYVTVHGFRGSEFKVQGWEVQRFKG